jgi:hypothetical protein
VAFCRNKTGGWSKNWRFCPKAAFSMLKNNNFLLKNDTTF